MALCFREVGTVVLAHHDRLVGRGEGLLCRRGVADQGDKPVDLGAEPSAGVHAGQYQGHDRDIACRGVRERDIEAAADRRRPVDHPLRPAVDNVKCLIVGPGEQTDSNIG
jgi:hypothetical protein